MPFGAGVPMLHGRCRSVWHEKNSSGSPNLPALILSIDLAMYMPIDLNQIVDVASPRETQAATTRGNSAKKSPSSFSIARTTWPPS
jgi:hypothetical protein